MKGIKRVADVHILERFNFDERRWLVPSMTEPYRDANEPLLPGEDPDLLRALAQTLGEHWLHERSVRFAGRSPYELIGTSDEYKLRNLLRTVTIAGIS